MSEISGVGLNRDETIQACRTNLNFFAAFCLPEVYAFPFPPIFLAIWQMLTGGALKDKGQEKLAIGLPRGFGKTIFLKLYVLWLVLFTDRKFIIIVGNTAALAENFLSDVLDVLGSPNIKSVFGDFAAVRTKDTQSLQKFHFCGRDIVIAALGSGTSLRGLNIKFVRPDTIIMDDMQSREQAESPVESEKQLTWLLATLLKANNKIRCQFTFVGNMYPYEGAILKKLKHNPAWTSFITGALLEDGESIWPDLRSVESIMDELEDDMSMGKPEIFFSEVMNDEEAGNRSGADINKIAVSSCTDSLGEPLEAEAGFVIIDPSVGKKTNDKIAIGTILFFDGKPVLREVKVDSFNPKQCIAECFRQAMHYGLAAILVESVAYQATLVFWMNEAKARFGLSGIRILEIYPGMMQKNSRILSMLKLLTAPKPEMYLHPVVRSQFVYQVVHWNPAKRNNVDDILDLAAYAHPAKQQFGSLLLRPFDLPPAPKGSFDEDLEIAF